MKKEQHHPPQLAKRIFRWYSGHVAGEDLEGDLDEHFYLNLQAMSPRRARWRYWRQMLSLFGSYVIRRRKENASLHPHSDNLINFNMIRNYLLIALRVMARNRVYTVINVLGLTLGLSACIIVFIVINHEFSFDRFHADRDRIFRLKTSDEAHPGWTCTCTPPPVYPTLRDDYAGSEAMAGYHHFDAKSSVIEGGHVKQFDRSNGNIIITNTDYFNIFQYQWLAGSKEALSKPMQVVLSESRARTYFGSIEPSLVLGKVVTYNDSLPLTVGGIVKDWKENSDFVRTEFISFGTIEHSFLRKTFELDNWGIMVHSSQSFIKIKKSDNKDQIASKLAAIIGKKTKEKYVFRLEELSRLHFLQEDENESTIMSVFYLVSALAIFILLIAAINFINLSTAQSINRSREIGIRKVIGSGRRQIILQFLSETFVLALIALLLSMALVRPLLFALQNYLPKGIAFNPIATDNLVFFVCLLFGVSILAGLYPALFTSAYQPASNLSSRNAAAGRGGFSLRRVLVVFQFTVSLFFISVTLVINSQMDYIKTKDRGFNTENVLTFRTNFASPVSKVKTLVDRIRLFVGDDHVTMQGFSPMGFAMLTNSFEFISNKGTIKGNTSIKAGDERYISMYQIRLIAGRNYQSADSLKEAVVNEAFVKSIGLDHPDQIIGEHVIINGKRLSICGVVRDFHQQSFRNAISPCLIADFKQEEHAVAIRFDGMVSDNTLTILKIEAAFKEVYPDETFSPHLIEEEIQWMHGIEERIFQVSRVAMAVTIFISCIGVFGLAMFTAMRRTREIGIRKVLGASVWRIVQMLNIEFVVLVGISIIIATPLAWFTMHSALNKYTYRIELSWWYFTTGALIALLTALATVSYQSWKAANGDPVKALRTE
ncbi:MAG TPA: ABC transporter permease [Cyclobacteriaceae bacterium]|jgi:ABC-type antimicrobial peptide transport system permease subunit|nr:ABC transporter permease [Cyclobacteriaceae bacterium]